MQPPQYQHLLTLNHVTSLFTAQSVGYGVVVGMTCPQIGSGVDYLITLFFMTGVGFFFAALMLALTYLQSKFSRYKPGSSEEFTVRFEAYNSLFL